MAIRRAAWAVVFATILAVGEGCGPQAGDAAGTQAREGHVYLAQLATRHPLYADLVRLDGAIRALRAPEQALTLPALSLAQLLDRAYVAGPVGLTWPEDPWAARRERAARDLAEKPPESPARLPADLEAKLRWKQLQAQRAASSQLLEAESSASRELAAATVELYRRNQERLNTLGDPSGATGESQEDVRAELEAEIEQLREKHEERLAQLERKLLASTEAKVAEARRAVWRQTRERMRPPTGAIARGLAEEMSAQMRAVQTPDWPAEVRVALPEPELPTDSEDTRARTAAVERERHEARERQAQSLIARRNQITDSILAATRIAAEKVARDRGIALRFCPQDDATGPDMTEEIGNAIQTLWAGQGT